MQSTVLNKQLPHINDKLQSLSPKPSPKEKIWHIVALIPKGKISSYGKIADYAGLPGRARFVSTALKQAPSHLTLPWHRVVNSQGKIAFEKHSPAFRDQMQHLIAEGVLVKNGRIKLSQFEWKPDMATLMLAMPF
ncbi:MGMT family protein [uncultured Shewanella sp.]|uniref:MGMT family protein n=1 Tax=uncultured Shewanella sp. TaxID=173975 RepID=UPI00262D29DB|nr:MGMT family protein [uncultured Shewanella sp.]